MVFSYLQAIAQRKRSQIFSSFGITMVFDIFLFFSLFSTNLTILRLQLVYLIAQMIMSIFILIAGIFAEEIFAIHVKNKNYKQIIDSVDLYNFRQKYGWLSNIFSVLSNGLAIYAMVALGWIAQPVVFLVMLVIGLTTLYSFVDNLPNQVAKSGLTEEDFDGYY